MSIEDIALVAQLYGETARQNRFNRERIADRYRQSIAKIYAQIVWMRRPMHVSRTLRANVWEWEST